MLIPGVRVIRYLQPAQDPTGAAAASAVYSFHQQAADPAVAPGPQASQELARTFQTSAGQQLSLTATAVATPKKGALSARALHGPGRSRTMETATRPPKL